MRWTAVAVVLIALATSGYFVLIPHPVVDRSTMSALSVSETGLPGVSSTPKAERTATGSSSTFPALKGAAENDPDATGIYEVQWRGSASSGRSAVLAIQLVPNQAAAVSLDEEARKQYSSPEALKGSSYGYSGHFPTGIDGATGSTFAGTSNTSARAYVEVLRVGRVVVIEFVASPVSGLSAADAASLGHREWSLLRQAEPGFTLAGTGYPELATFLYWSGFVFLVTVVGLAIWSGRSIARARARRRESQMHYGHRSRGSKTLRRHSLR
jgi:hypothetical protein